MKKLLIIPFLLFNFLLLSQNNCDIYYNPNNNDTIYVETIDSVEVYNETDMIVYNIYYVDYETRINRFYRYRFYSPFWSYHFMWGFYYPHWYYVYYPYWGWYHNPYWYGYYWHRPYYPRYYASWRNVYDWGYINRGSSIINRPNNQHYYGPRGGKRPSIVDRNLDSGRYMRPNNIKSSRMENISYRKENNIVINNNNIRRNEINKSPRIYRDQRNRPTPDNRRVTSPHTRPTPNRNVTPQRQPSPTRNVTPQRQPSPSRTTTPQNRRSTPSNSGRSAPERR